MTSISDNIFFELLDENIVDENVVMMKFKKTMYNMYSDANKYIKQYTDSNDKSLLKIIKNKFPFLKNLKITKRIKKIENKEYVYQFLENDAYEKYNENFTENEKKIIYKYCVKKIRGTFKHAQALKTGYCNLQIITGFSEENTISICITKNTLESNEQWLERLFKELDHRFPHAKLNDKIMIISSKKNTLNGNATHCKDINTAWRYLKRKNSFKIIFICSNKIRIADILEISEDFQNLSNDLQKKIRIFHDEAHNQNEGIPAYRQLIENIVMQPNILMYMPISASNGSMIDDANPLWQKNNLENNASDYTDFDKTKSTDIHFASCSKAIRINFEDIDKEKWLDYEIKQLPKDTYMKAYEKKYSAQEIYLKKQESEFLKTVLKNRLNLFKSANLSSEYFVLDDMMNNLESYSNSQLIHNIMLVDVERKRTLEFCSFMKDELEAVNNGMNSLNMNNLLGFEYYIHNSFNIHIISTPKRNGITRFLCEEALKKPYNPIVLGIYGNEGEKYHLLYDNQQQEVSHIMDKGEFNIKLEKLFTKLRTDNINMNRPFIIIGNYNPTGESLTFVNYSYGTVRGNIRLISTNAEEDYQEASRSNYMATKFIENDPYWIMPEKYLIGPIKFIDNAMSYEAENDARIDYMLENNGNRDTEISLPSFSNDSNTNSSNGIVAIPIKITISDINQPLVVQMRELIQNNVHRTEEQKKEFMNILEEYVKKGMDSGECEFEDKTGKFSFDNYKINTLRGYIQKEESPKKGHWKFKNYLDHFNTDTTFINDKNKIQINQCEILTCIDNYIIKDNGVIIEKNAKNTWWIGYKY
jgi:hypothetical protein